MNQTRLVISLKFDILDWTLGFLSKGVTQPCFSNDGIMPFQEDMFGNLAMSGTQSTPKQLQDSKIFLSKCISALKPVVFLAPAFQGSGVITFPSFFWPTTKYRSHT